MRQKKQLSLVISSILCGLLYACNTPESKSRFESGWAHLDGVDGIKCSPWPLRQTELDVTYMTADATQSGGFVAGVRLRNGSRTPVFAETGGRLDLSVDNLTPLPIGRDAYVLAPFTFEKESLAFVVQNKNERSWLEVRSIKDNRLVARMATPLSKEADTGRLVTSSSGWWLQINHDDREASYVFVAVKDKAQWVFNVSEFQTHSRYAALIGHQLDEQAFAVENSGKGDDSNSNFTITRLETAGKFSVASKVTIPTKGGLESWSPVSVGKKIVFASVRGDSMVGQGVLTVSAFDMSAGGANLSWRKEFPFSDVHLGEPVWLSNGHRAFIALMKWVDSETVLTRIKVDSNSAEMVPDIGVFARGTILASGYFGPENSGLGAFRFREKDLWKYKLCKLSL